VRLQVSQRPKSYDCFTDMYPVRASPRIASLHRNTSYADLDGRLSEESEGEEEYSSEQEYDFQEEDEFRPSKRSKGSKRAYGRKPMYQNNRVGTIPQCSEADPHVGYTQGGAFPLGSSRSVP